MFPKIIIALFVAFLGFQMYYATTVPSVEDQPQKPAGPCFSSDIYANMTDAELDYERTLPLHKEYCVPEDRRK